MDGQALMVVQVLRAVVEMKGSEDYQVLMVLLATLVRLDCLGEKVNLAYLDLEGKKVCQDREVNQDQLVFQAGEGQRVNLAMLDKRDCQGCKAYLDKKEHMAYLAYQALVALLGHLVFLDRMVLMLLLGLHQSQEDFSLLLIPKHQEHQFVHQEQYHFGKDILCCIFLEMHMLKGKI